MAYSDSIKVKDEYVFLVQQNLLNENNNSYAGRVRMNFLAGKLEREERKERREKLTEERIKLKYRKYVEIVKGGKNYDDLIKKVRVKKMNTMRSTQLKEELLLSNKFHSLINQTEKEDREEKEIKVIPSFDQVSRLKERFFLAANI